MTSWDGTTGDEPRRVFRRNGMAVLLYDHRNFGASEGEPRQEINPEASRIQTEFLKRWLF